MDEHGTARSFGILPKIEVHLIICLVLSLIGNGMSFNVATVSKHIASSPNVVNKERSSYFGYTVGLLQTNLETWLLVGAPRANSSGSMDVIEPGAMYKCPLVSYGNCEEVILDTSINFEKSYRTGYPPFRNYAWTGAALDIDSEGNVIVCAPLWKHVGSKKNTYKMSGICYIVDSSLQNDTATQYSPMLLSSKQIYRSYGTNFYFYTHGEYGFDVHITAQKQMLVGSPGVLNWKGSVAKYDYGGEIPAGGNSKRDTSENYILRVIPNPGTDNYIKDSSYLGYSVTSGFFDHYKYKLYYVSGAPRAGGSFGIVYIFLMRQYEAQRIFVKETKQGLQMGEYFGSSVVAPDLNDDGLSELVVGAPMHSTDNHYDVGCVYVYMNTNDYSGTLAIEPIVLYGKVENRARFGSSLGTPGDLDRDGYNDLLVGAPYENDYRGAVYVYMGSPNGVDSQYSQKLIPEEVSTLINLKGFGISFSRPLDADRNQYPDFAVGSFISENAVLMQTRPVVVISGKIRSIPPKLDLNANSFLAIPCVTFEGLGISQSIEIIANIGVTQESPTGDILVSFGDGSTGRELHFNATKDNDTCLELDVELNKERSNAKYPIIFNMEFHLKNEQISEPENPIISPYKTEPVTLVLNFITGCDESICRSNLVAKARFKGFDHRGDLLIGETNKITLEVDVSNMGDPAFLPNITITIPKPLIILPTLQDCTNDQDDKQTTIICQLSNPLKKYDKEVLKFDLDTSKLDDTSPTIRGKVYADSAADIETVPDDNSFPFQLKVKKEAEAKATGWSRKEQYTYERLNETYMKSNGTINIKHIFSIEKKGVTPLNQIFIEVSVPMSYTTIRGQTLTFVHNIQNELTFHSKSFACEIDQDNTQLSGNASISENPTLSPDESPLLHSLNCSSGESIKCAHVMCRVGPWKSSYDVASLTISFDLNYTSLNQLISVKDGFTFTSNVEGGISPHNELETLTGQRKFNNTVQTVFYPGSLPAYSLAWWIYLLAILGGVLLLLLIAYILYKVGFFTRADKEKLIAQKATLQSQEE